MMLRLTARIGKRGDVVSTVRVSVNDGLWSEVIVDNEQANELVGLLNAATGMREALDALPPDKLELLATWFDVQQAKRPEWKDADRGVQGDLRQMARLSRAALPKAKGGT